MAELQEEEIRARMQQARKQAGLSREKLADLLTVHVNSIRNYEAARVPWASMNAWAAATGVSLQWLLHGEEAASTVDGEQLQRIENVLLEIRDLLARGAAGQDDSTVGSHERLVATRVKQRRAEKESNRQPGNGEKRKGA